jgi:hypothetical protein
MSTKSPGWPRTGLLLALGVALAGCAPEADLPGPAPTDAGLSITVEHDLPVATSLTVHLIDPTGTTRRLGSVSPGSSRTFSLPERAQIGDYRLVAAVADGRRVTSRPFILSGRYGVRWSPSANVVVPDSD